MKTSTNTILITGGGSGIGFEMARLFSQNGNKVIITGRNEERLVKAASQLKNVTTIVCDINSESAVDALVKTLKRDFPELNLLINNAGKAFLYDVTTTAINGFDKASEEMMTNYFSVIRLTEALLPTLKEQETAAIVNVSSVGAFVPVKVLATYSASKAALHSYTQSLRLSLAETNVKVFELMPPLVNTDFSKEIGGENGIHPSEVAEKLFNALADETYEIHPGKTADVYNLFLSSPQNALEAMNN